MDKVIVEALKNKVKPFGLMTDEMQAAAKEIGLTDCFKAYRGYSGQGGWGDLWRATGCKFKKENTYQLRKDYQPAPSVIECEIDPPDSNGQMWVRLSESHTMDFGSCVGHKDFIGFKYAGNRVSIQPRIYASEHLYEDLIKEDTLEKHEVLIPTHVLFRRDK
jgi:hypothetical protein